MAIPVSAKWKEAIQSQFRYPAYLKAALLVSPPGLRESAEVETDSSEPLTPARATMDGSSVTASPVASFEPNRWRGDGSMYLPSEKQPQNRAMGWWSSSEATNEKPVVLSFKFDQPYTVPGIFVSWDLETATWPTKVVLKGFGLSGDLKAEYLIESIDSPSGYTDAPFDSVTRIDLEIYSWSISGWRVRIAEIMFGVSLEFNNDDIATASLSSSASLLSADLPSLSLQLTLYNYDSGIFDPLLEKGYSKYLAERQQIRVQWGFNVDSDTIQWMDPWPMYLSSWDIPTDSSNISIGATSRLDFLTSTYREGLYTGGSRTFREIAQRVLSEGGIIKESDYESPWELPPIFSELYTNAPEPEEAVNTIVQLLANAAGCIMDIDSSNNYVRVRESCTDSGYTLDQLQQLSEPAFEIDSQLKSIQVGLRTFTPNDIKERVYKLEETLSGDVVLDIEYDSGSIVIEPEIEVSGAILLEISYYARHAKATLRAPKSVTNVTVAIKGYVVNESTTLITTYSNPEVTSGLEVVVDNPFVTNVKTLKTVATAVERVYLRRQTVKLKYMGYPELEVGDTMDFKTKYGDFKGELTSLSLVFNGGFNGEVTARIGDVDA